jgi:hypothetical protein
MKKNQNQALLMIDLWKYEESMWNPKPQNGASLLFGGGGQVIS